MMNYTLKNPNGEIVTVKACDYHQAIILAAARFGKEYLRADVIKAVNSL